VGFGEVVSFAVGSGLGFNSSGVGAETFAFAFLFVFVLPPEGIPCSALPVAGEPA
jgi:hypothetical protein